MFAELAQGEAVIYTTHGPDPQRTTILPVALKDRAPKRIASGARHPCELRVHPEQTLPPITQAGDRTPQPDKIDHGSASL
jgi:hypothetical protein